MKTIFPKPSAIPFHHKTASEIQREERRWALAVIVLCLAVVAAAVALFTFGFSEGSYWIGS